MINIQLKAKHYYLISDVLFNGTAREAFSTLQKIKTACSGSNDEDVVSVVVDWRNIYQVFSILTYKPEGQYNRINSEMDDLLTAQVVSGSLSGNEEWVSLGQAVLTLKTENLSVVSGSIQSGKSKLYAD